MVQKLAIWFFTLISIAGVSVMLEDIYCDIGANKSLMHIISDALVGLVMIFATVFAWLYANIRFKTAERRPVNPVALASIEAELKAWRLTRAETDVALWIVRGLNFYQIADLLGKSERTVRQQAISIYAKAGFRNRSELTGYFVENLGDLPD